MLLSFFGNTYQPHALPRLEAFVRRLLALGVEIETEREFAGWLLANSDIRPRRIVDTPSPGTSLIVSLGGDGTFLRAARWQLGASVPLAGINTGHLGYLAPWSLDEADLLVDTLRDPNHEIDIRRQLAVKLPPQYEGLIACPLALNEVALHKDSSASMIVVPTHLNGKYLTDYQADALVIATPTGSTAYNLSGGGPILQPSAPAIVLTPIAPHTLTMRPIVVEDSASIEVRPSTRSGSFLLALDGVAYTLPSGTPVSISKAEEVVRILRHPADDFAGTLRSKLLWGTSTTLH